jgi:hypothetical protein
MARLGSVAAAPFVGSEFVSLYLGEERVPTVQGKPSVNAAYDNFISVTQPQNDGGSAITSESWRVYVDGVFKPLDEFEFAGDGGWSLFLSNDTLVPGEAVQVSAINAVGEGPRSAPFAATAAP